MKIKKMLLLAGMALAAIAFTVPATAQAVITLQDTNTGTPLVQGDGVTMTSTNFNMTLGSNTLTCTKVTLHYQVEKNGHNHVVLNPLNTPDGHNAGIEHCTLHTAIGSFTVNMTNAGSGSITINTWGTGTTSWTMTMGVPALGLHCTLTGTVPFQASHTNHDILTVETPNTLTGAPQPPCSNAEIHCSFTIERPNGNPLKAVFVKTT